MTTAFQVRSLERSLSDNWLAQKAAPVTIPNQPRPNKHRTVGKRQETSGNVGKRRQTSGTETVAGALQLLDQLNELVRAGEMTDHLGVVRKAAKHLRVTSAPAITVENGGAHHGQ